MTLTVKMLDLAAAVIIADQVGRVVLAKDRQSLVELVLLDIAMRCEIATGGASRDEVFAG